MENENIIIPSEFADICPIQDKDFHNEMSILVNEPMFKQIAQIIVATSFLNCLPSQSAGLWHLMFEPCFYPDHQKTPRKVF